MPKSWRRGFAYCAAKNKDGSPCGNKVATMARGVSIYRYCHVHRKRAITKEGE